MSEIRRLVEDDLDDVARIVADAYPGWKIVSAEDREKFKEQILRRQRQDPTAALYGLFREGTLLGTMALHDFVMNFLGARVPVGGVGLVAVALDHKKEHVAKEMISYFLRHCRAGDKPLAALYPFRPDFYRQMGFGYGTKMNEYRVRPDDFPRGPSKARVRYLTASEQEALATCYGRVAARTHGMMDKTAFEVQRIFERTDQRVVGCEIEGAIRGYLAFRFEEGETFLVNDLRVQELIYETREALADLLTWLHSQADQVRHVYLHTQDDDFHHLLHDPRNHSGRMIPSVYHESNTQGVGLMYRVVDVAGILERLAARDFGGQTLALRLAIEDSFLPENAGSRLLSFEGGHLVETGNEGRADVEVSLAIEDFSSLLAGTVRFESLYNYRRAEISNARYVDAVNRLFAVEKKPACTTAF